MKRLLYVDCCIRGQTSRTRRLAEAFLDALPQGWAVEPLELAAEGLQYFSGPFFQQRQDLLAAGNPDSSAIPLRLAICPGRRHCSGRAPVGPELSGASEGLYRKCQCREHHLWLRRGRLLRHLPSPAHGLPHHRGSAYEGSHLEMGSRYLQAMAEFFGIDRYDCVAADGLDAMGANPESILRAACAQAAELAKTF